MFAKVSWKTYLLILITLHLADVWVTSTFLQLGGIEANPIISALTVKYGTWSVLVYKLVGVSLYFLYIMRYHDERERAVLLAFMVGIMALIVLYGMAYCYHLIG
jgi:hypothetical protein